MYAGFVICITAPTCAFIPIVFMSRKDNLVHDTQRINVNLLNEEIIEKEDGLLRQCI